MTDITEIIVVLIGLLTAIIGAFIAPKLSSYLELKNGEEDWANITAWAKTFVEAAEVIYNKTGLTGLGESKKKWVIDNIEEQCRKFEVEFSYPAVEAALESAWKNMTASEIQNDESQDKIQNDEM